MVTENLVEAVPRAQDAAPAAQASLRLPKLGKRIPAFFDKYLVVWVVPVAILIFWQIAAQLGWIQTRILPAPTAVVQAALKLSLSGELFHHITISTGRALTGLAVGGSIGFLLGMSNGLFKLSEKLLDSTLQMIRTIPNLSLVPLVILWFGIGDNARLFLIAIGVFFPIYVNTFHGIRNVDSGLIEMGKAYGLSTRELFFQVIFPGALPSILLGLRLSLGIMWLTLIIAETIATESGIGYLATSAREFMRTDVLLFVVIVYALLGKLSDAVTRLLERRFLRWQPRYQKGGTSA